MIRRDPTTMTAEELSGAMAAIRLMRRATARRGEIRASLPSHLSVEERWQQSTLQVVEELGELLVDAIREQYDRRVTTRAGAVRFLLRDLFDTRTRTVLRVPVPEMPADWKIRQRETGR